MINIITKLVSSCVYFTGFEVNFMDDVGQTLLNWASAFGTQEMVILPVKGSFFLGKECAHYWLTA